MMFVETKSSSLKKGDGRTFEAFVFKSKKNDGQVLKKKESSDKSVETKKRENEELDMKKLRYEVIKFGTSGFDGLKKEESRVAFAIALGAKPPKNKCRNYVDVLAERKREAVKESASLRKNARNGFRTKGTLKRKQNKGKVAGELLHNYGKIRPK